MNYPDLDRKLVGPTERQHHIAIDEFKKETIIQNGTYKEYINETEKLIKKNDHEKALQLLAEALRNHPNNPIILSYQGCLEAIVNNKYSKGISNCLQALEIIKEQISFNKAYYLSILYLNLGRVYLTADKRKEAFDAFKKGLETDNIHEGLICEIEKLGLRRNLPFPFLKRSNPLNKYVGKLIYKLNQE